MQFWRIGHIGATLFIKFRIEGMPLYVVARDGHPLTQPQKVSEFFVGPGERIEAIAVGPDPGQIRHDDYSLSGSGLAKALSSSATGHSHIFGIERLES
jgi:FtsP/CotA-like multicopper oxidase with cupredoxin domain